MKTRRRSMAAAELEAEIANVVKEAKRKKEQPSAKSVAARIGVSANRLIEVARSCQELVQSTNLYMGTRWATFGGLKEHFQLETMQVSNVLRKKKEEIEIEIFPTHQYPLGEIFYSIPDFFLVAPKIHYNVSKREKRSKEPLPEISEKPKDLTEGEYATLRALIVVAIRRERVSYSNLTTRFGLSKDEETTRLWIVALKKKGYIDFKRDLTGTRMNLYRFPGVNKLYRHLLMQVDSRLVEPFTKGADK